MNFGRSRVARDGRRFRCESAASPPQNTKRCIPRASLLGTRPGASEQVPHEQKFPRTLVAPPPIHTHRNTNALREGRLGLPAGVRKQRAWCRAGGSLCGDAACSRMWYSSAAALVSPAGLGLGAWCVSLLSLGGFRNNQSRVPQRTWQLDNISTRTRPQQSNAQRSPSTNQKPTDQ